MGSADVAGLEPHGEMLFREISPSWTLDGQSKKRKWQLKIGPFGRFSQVGQQVQIMHDAFHDDDDEIKYQIMFDLFVIVLALSCYCFIMYDVTPCCF